MVSLTYPFFRGEYFGPLFPDVSLQSSWANFCSVNIAPGIHRNAFRRAGAGARPRVGIWVGVWNEGCDLAVLGAADPYSPLPSWIPSRARLRVSGVQDIVSDVQPADSAELLPLLEKLSILIEDLNSIVISIGDEESPLRIHCKRVRRVELA